MNVGHRWTMATVVIPIVIFLAMQNMVGAEGGHNSPCRNYKDCNVSQNLICDKKASKTCVCPLNYYYDLDQDLCVAEVDHRCTLETETNPPFVKCVKNAKCVKIVGLPMNQGICECDTGFGRTPYGFCDNVKSPDYQPFIRSGAVASVQISILINVLIISNIVLVVDKFFDVF